MYSERFQNYIRDMLLDYIKETIFIGAQDYIAGIDIAIISEASGIKRGLSLFKDQLDEHNRCLLLNLDFQLKTAISIHKDNIMISYCKRMYMKPR